MYPKRNFYLSYANALKGDKPNQNSKEPKTNNQKATSAQRKDTPPPPQFNDNDNNNEKPFGYMDVIFEIRKLFANYPFLFSGETAQSRQNRHILPAYYQ
ncbi:hypothetical protein TNCT_80181 [Trichonephila clavata]|uniref:Uncharacterized protein n=1 Tax=Trichonephila clavata TaxID=2740835 RepID=A0A8X6FF27_TRICU|nr:hypothetical protein TNCT_80181 [Trichonephila clavata]